MEEVALYRPILKKAWQLTRRAKSLWFFGLFAAILGTGGEYEILAQSLLQPSTDNEGFISGTINGFISGWQDGASTGGNILHNVWTAIVHYPQNLVLIILLFLISLTVALFFIWLAVISQIGIIRNIDLISKNKTATLNDGIDFAVKKFWPILGINAILKVIMFILFLVLSKELILLGDRGLIEKLIYYLSFIIFIILILTISFLFRYQIYYLLLKKQSWQKAFASAWKLFKDNWLVSLEMALIIFILYSLAALLTFIIGDLLLAVIVVLTLNYSIPIIITGSLSIFFFFLILVMAIFITIILSTLQWSAWTLLFNRLTGEGGISKIIRASQQLPQLLSRNR